MQQASAVPVGPCRQLQVIDKNGTSPFDKQPSPYHMPSTPRTDRTMGGAAAAVAAKLTGGRARSDNSDETPVSQMMEQATADISA